MLGSIAMTPASEKKIQENPEKYKYVFRVSLNVTGWVGLIVGTMKTLNEKFGFNKVYLMNQDVLWARGTAKGMQGWFEKNGWEVLGHDEFPTGATDFSSGLMKTNSSGAQILFTCFDMPQSGILVNQWKSMKVPALMAGFISPMAGQGAWKTFNGKIGGLLNAVFELGNIGAAKVPTGQGVPRRLQEDDTGSASRPGMGLRQAMNPCTCSRRPSSGRTRWMPTPLWRRWRRPTAKASWGASKFSPGHQVVFGVDPNETATGCLLPVERKGQADHRVSTRPGRGRHQAASMDEVRQIACTGGTDFAHGRDLFSPLSKRLDWGRPANPQRQQDGFPVFSEGDLREGAVASRLTSGGNPRRRC